MAASRLAQIMKECSLFQGLTIAQLERITSVANEGVYRSDTPLFWEGDRVRDLFVVVDGSVQLTMDLPLRNREMTYRAIIDTIQPGEAFGWYAIVEPHMATMTALTNQRSTLISFDGVGLTRLMDHEPVLGYKIMTAIARMVARRLGATQEHIAKERAGEVEGMGLPF